MGAVLLGVWKLDDKHAGDESHQFHSVQGVYELIDDEYYKPLDTLELKRAAVRGMVESLDGFTTYFPPKSADLVNQRIRGISASLGLELQLEPTKKVSGDGILIIGALLNSPGHKAGIYPGSRILQINGNPVKGLTQKQVQKLLTDKLTKTVELKIIDPTGDESLITLLRKPFEVETIQGLYRNADTQWVFDVPDNEDMLNIQI